MAKRATHDADGAAAFRKRQKITHEVPVGEDVVDSAQLRQLLSFDQDMRKARHGKYQQIRSTRVLLSNWVNS